MADELPGAVENPPLFEIGDPGVGVVARGEPWLERFEFDPRAPRPGRLDRLGAG